MKSKNNSSKKQPIPAGSTGEQVTLFDKGNYRLMLIGLVLMIAGFLLMVGGKSSNPNVFDADAIYSFRRITLAPLLIVGGLVVEIFAIMKKPKA